jgi:uncharacterized protein YgiM (DUF1202 family)
VQEAQETGGADASTATAAQGSAQPDAVVPAATSTASKDEWVALSRYANLRSAPSSTAPTIKIAEKGSKLRVDGRKGNWVQVTDPATSETGWVYSRFIETAQPAQ